MVELYPILSEDGKVTSHVASYGEFTLLISNEERPRLFLWFGEEAIEVTELFREKGGVLNIGEYTIDIGQWFEIVTKSTFYTFEDLDEYIAELSKHIRKVIENKSVLLSYSGGKDSTASLITLSKLREYVSFRLYVCYTYIPYLENVKNLDFVQKVSEKLGLTIEVLSPPRNIVKKYLLRYGLPYRRARWCTYLKVRPLREFMKKNCIDFRVVGDRLTECEKRWKRLIELALSYRYVGGRELRVTFTMTLLDVVRLCRENDLVNPLYVRGMSRVSCVYCPYKTMYELYIENIDELEDPGLIEHVLKRSYEKWYADKVSYEDFIRFHLWRYVPNVAKMFSVLRRSVKEHVRESTTLNVKTVAAWYRSLWTNPLPKVDVVRDVYEIVRRVKRYNVRELILHQQPTLSSLVQ